MLTTPLQMLLFAIAGWLNQYSSRRGENVLDLFGGSGSTLVACDQTDRHAFLYGDRSGVL